LTRYPIMLAIIAIGIVLYALISINQRTVTAVVPYCFAGKFGEAGFFQPCAELKRFYQI